MNAGQLALRVLRGDRRTRTSAILTGVGVAVATGLVLLLVSLPFATQVSAERSQWQQQRSSVNAERPAQLLMSTSEDFVDGQKITRIDVAPVGNPGAITLPPGLSKFPAPGETWVSPALGKLMHGLPAAQLADRFTPNVAGALGNDALRFPEQLVALVGHNATDMPPDAIPAPGFTQGGARPDGLLQLLSGVGVVVLLVPSLVLVASAARLTAARRERRLAALRLAGATPGQVTGMVAAETALSAIAGAVAGWALSPALHGLATFVPWDGGTWQASDFTLPPVLTAVLVVAIPVLVVLAAVLGLRRVLATPLGAAAGHSRKPLHWWRLLALPVAGAFFLFAIAQANSGRDSSGLMVLFGLALLVGSAALVGPWVTSAVGGTFVRVWRKPAGLLAGRRLRDDPKGAYRASAGVVLAVFAGSMALTLIPSLESLAGGGRAFQDSVLYVETNPANAAKIAQQTDTALAKYGEPARSTVVRQVDVKVSEGGRSTGYSALVMDCATALRLTRFNVGSCAAKPGIYSSRQLDLRGASVISYSDTSEEAGTPLAADVPLHLLSGADSDVTSSLLIDPAVLPAGFVASPNERVTVAVPSTDANRETIRTALGGAGGGAQVYSRELRLGNQQSELADLRRVTVIGLIAAAVLAGCSAAVATAGSVMDRRRTLGALIAAGTPVKVLARALRVEAALPAMVATIGAGVVGVVVGIGLFSLVKEHGLVLSPWILAPVVLGVGVALLAASVCTPALNRVRAEPLADE
jgi:ABC-type lipoprotein release transport system permease subunit